MGATRFHSLGWDAPDLIVKVELVPNCEPHFIRAAECVCREEERHARNHVGVFVEIAHEPGDFRLRDDGREVLDPMRFDALG